MITFSVNGVDIRTAQSIYITCRILYSMERKSKTLYLDPKKEITIPSHGGGLLTYPTDAVLTAQVGVLDDDGRFSKVKVGAGCTAILIVLKKNEKKE